MGVLGDCGIAAGRHCRKSGAGLPQCVPASRNRQPANPIGMRLLDASQARKSGSVGGTGGGIGVRLSADEKEFSLRGGVRCSIAAAPPFSL